MLDEKEIKDEEIADTQTASEEVSGQQEPVDENPKQEEVVVNENMPNEENTPVDEVHPRMFSQEEVNELIGKTRSEARNRANAAYYERYGVENDEELNNLVGRGQSYQVLEDNFNNQKAELEALKTDYALLKSGIVPERYEDVKLIIKGKGFEVNEATISQELATHPEWLGSNQTTTSVSATNVVPAVDDAAIDSQVEPAPTRTMFTRQMAEDIIKQPKEAPTPTTNNVVKKLGNTIPETEESDDEAMRALRYFGIN